MISLKDQKNHDKYMDFESFIKFKSVLEFNPSKLGKKSIFVQHTLDTTN